MESEKNKVITLASLCVLSQITSTIVHVLVRGRLFSFYIHITIPVIYLSISVVGGNS